MFDQCESRRDRLEKKAQWVFAVLAFLVPALFSLSSYLIRNGLTLVENRFLVTVYLVVFSSLLILSFVSAARAMAVQSGLYPFIQSVIDGKSGGWKSYEMAEHVRTLLSCTLVNTRMNDQIAQFVKGAHCLMLVSVLLFALVAIIEIGTRLNDNSSSPLTLRSDDSGDPVSPPCECPKEADSQGVSRETFLVEQAEVISQ